MHPTDEMSLHQSVTPFGKNNYVKPPPNKKGENTKTKNNTKQTINTGKKPSTNQNTDIFLNSKMTKTNKNTTFTKGTDNAFPDNIFLPFRSTTHNH